MDDFERLTKIRYSRLAKIRTAEGQAGKVCAERRNDVEQDYHAIENYRCEVETLEIDLLNDIMRKEITTQTVFELEKTLKDAERKTLDLANALKRSRRNLKSAEQELEEMRSYRIVAQKNQERLSLLNDLLNEDVRQQARLKEDRSFDEIADTLSAINHHRAPAKG